MKNKLSNISRILLLLPVIMLVASLFFPIWRIELDAPQYPEGLELQLWANRIDGDVDIINGLNHYIGMKTLHTENFFEFTVLPYIISFFALFSLVVAFINRKRAALVLFISFIIFAILSAIDFYRWNYDYGHDLDPNAAIKVPGMAYQPPMLGFKQLLNFGAYSIPDTGGWLLILSGFLMFIIIVKEFDMLKKFKKKKVATAVVMLFSLGLFSCGNSEAVPITLNSDQCDHCKMSISDGKFGAEVITQKGRVYKFDDIFCLIEYTKSNQQTAIKAYYVHDYAQDNVLIPAETAFYIKNGDINSPMRGNTAAFTSQDEADKFAVELNAEKTDWKTMMD
ncbi:MAG: nitrous oxide reductase accessory protein NosL [Flavobacteriaceae bacterium]